MHLLMKLFYLIMFAYVKCIRKKISVPLYCFRKTLMKCHPHTSRIAFVYNVSFKNSILMTFLYSTCFQKLSGSTYFVTHDIKLVITVMTNVTVDIPTFLNYWFVYIYSCNVFQSHHI